MMRMLNAVMRILAPAALVGLACIGAVPTQAEAEPLYFALEVRREGRLVAQPKLLGETGRTVRAERRKPGASQPDYRLVLTPTAEGETFHLELDLMLPEIKGHSELALLHGHFHNGVRGWADHAPLQEICFPSALYNQDRRLAEQRAPGFYLAELRPGFVRVLIESNGMRLFYHPTGIADASERLCPLPQLQA